MRHLWKIALAIVAVVMLTGAGCESGTVPGTHHWRRATQTDGSAETLVFVMVPATNPVTGAQGIVGTPVEQMIRRVIARWDATPDLALALSFQTTGGSNACPGDNFGNNTINCINVWRVTNDYLHTRYGANVAGAAPVWGDDTHFYSGPIAPSTEPSRIEVSNDWSGFDPIVEENAYCHELGHVWDLQHPTDGSAGPCDGSAIVDADDASALDTTIDACHFDGPSTNTPPAGSTPYGGDDPCGSGGAAAPRTAQEPGPKPTVKVTGVHTFTDFQHQAQ